MISNRCARKSLVTSCNSIISKSYLRFLVDSNDSYNIFMSIKMKILLCDGSMMKIKHQRTKELTISAVLLKYAP